MTSPARVSELHDVEIVGPRNAPAIVVLGGISSSRHVTASPDDPSPGWWDDFVGPDKTIDTNQFRVVSIDYGASSTGSGRVSAWDHAAALGRALDNAGIERIRGIVGASYGGTVALAFCALQPERADRLIVYGAAHESAAIATAHRALQRKVVELGLRAGYGREALVIARGLAITTYSTAKDFAEQFRAVDPAERCRTIEKRLAEAGERFAEHMTPERFLELSQSLDSNWVDPGRIRTPTTLIGVVEDALVPLSQLRTLENLIGSACTLEIVSSRHGHDAFLNDTALIAPIVSRALKTPLAIVP